MSLRQQNTLILSVDVALISLSILFNYSLAIGFFSAILFTLLILYTNAREWKDNFTYSFKEATKFINLYLTIVLIGATVAIWLSSGTIATMIYCGLDYIEGINFVLFSFILMSCCSFFMGTAVGTFSTIGLILYSIGSIVGINQNLLIGALISGAFIADKISPLSGLVNINLSVCEISYKKAFLYSLRIFIPSIIITAIIYYILGKNFIVTDINKFMAYKYELLKAFNINKNLIFFPIFIIFLSISGMKSIKTISIGVIVGGIITYFIQKKTIIQIISYILYGYKSDINYELANLIKGGGMIPMMEVATIVFLAILFVNILTNANVLDVLIEKFSQNINSEIKLINKTILLSIILTVFTCDQTIGLILPLKLFKEKFDEFGTRREVIFQILSDSGVIVAPLMPWNINYIVLTAVLGFKPQYFIYAFLCYIIIFVTIIYYNIFYKIRDKKLPK